jgi:hypothetical protein
MKKLLKWLALSKVLEFITTVGRCNIFHKTCYFIRNVVIFIQTIRLGMTWARETRTTGAEGVSLM